MAVTRWKQTTFFFLAVLVPLILSRTSSSEFAPALAVFATTLILWFTEIIPLPVAGLLVPVLIALYGVLPSGEAFRPFGSEIVFLFIGCFLLARAMQKHGWDKRMAYRVLSTSWGARSPDTLVISIGVICWVLSMWASNTAVCAMMTPVCLGLGSFFDTNPKPGLTSAFTKRLLFTCAFASSIGGLATPIGTPPNLIFFEFMKGQDIEISFFRWMLVALPISIIMLLMMFGLLKWRFPSTPFEFQDVQSHFKQKLEALGPPKPEELQVAMVFALAVVFWVAPGLLELRWPDNEAIATLNDRVSMSVVGLLAGVSFFLLPRKSKPESNLVWSDAHQIDWGTILLFGSGLALGNMLNQSGLAQLAGETFFVPDLSVLLFILSGVVFAVLMSEFASNTASASILLPIMLSAVVGASLDQGQIAAVMVATTMAASFGFMLPVSTPPNAIIFGTGRIKTHEMIRTGSLFDLFGALILLVGAVFFFPKMF